MASPDDGEGRAAGPGGEDEEDLLGAAFDAEFGDFGDDQQGDQQAAEDVPASPPSAGARGAPRTNACTPGGAVVHGVRGAQLVSIQLIR